LFKFLLLLLRPYRERYLMSAQILTIIATLPSVVHISLLISSSISTLWFQSLWFCRWNYYSLMGLSGISSLTGLAMLFAGVLLRDDMGDGGSYTWGNCYVGDERFLCSNAFLTITCSLSALAWNYSAYCVLKITHKEYDGGGRRRPRTPAFTNPQALPVHREVPALDPIEGRQQLGREEGPITILSSQRLPMEVDEEGGPAVGTEQIRRAEERGAAERDPVAPQRNRRKRSIHLSFGVRLNKLLVT
jgi:hypothetical protein